MPGLVVRKDDGELKWYPFWAGVYATITSLLLLGFRVKEAGVTLINLLLSILKDIEKKHRSKDISDETYHKLKDEYKQQAVEVMKKIEDKK